MKLAIAFALFLTLGAGSCFGPVANSVDDIPDEWLDCKLVEKPKPPITDGKIAQTSKR